MVPLVLKNLFIPGSYEFFLITLIPGTLLLYRRKDGGRIGKVWITLLVLSYWILSTPIAAVAVIGWLTPSYSPVQSREDAPEATAIVVLGAGMNTYRSRGDVFDGSNREHALRMLEAARVYRVLDRPWVIATGSLGNERTTEAHHIANDLKSMGVDADRILEEDKSTNTRGQALLVQPMLRERGVKQFVLVTSQQHIARSLRVFRAVGLNPIPSTPEPYVLTGRRFDQFLPSDAALEASSGALYDKLAIAYYWMRGWI